MNTALCTINNQTYTAADFEHSVDFTTNRNHLLCPECGVRATYRRQGSDNRSACFRALHADGCTQERIHANTAAVNPVAAPEAEITEYPVPAQECIVVDFRQDLRTDRPEALSSAIQRSNAEYRRTTVLPLRTLHGDLIVNDDLLSSQKSIVIPGRGDFPADDLFVNFADVSADHIDQYHGYWGQINRIEPLPRTYWFNSGGPNDVSIGVDIRYADELVSRFNLLNPESIESMDMLIFGELRHSDAKNKFIIVDDLNYMSIRIMRRF